MKLTYLAYLLVLLILLPSCVAKKKYLALQDELNTQTELRKSGDASIEDLETQAGKLKAELDLVTQELKASQDQYQNLLDQSLDNTQVLNQELSRKTAEVENQRRLLEAFQQELEEREAKVKELNAIISRQDSLSQALLAKVESALVSFEEDELTVTMRDGKVYVSLSDQLLFQSGSANVNSKGRDALIKVAEVLNKNPEIQVTIEGHTDNVPIKTSRFSDNWDLSVLRATEVVRILIWSGKVDPTRLKAAGRGQHQPVASNEDREARAKNRRTEIILEPDLGELYSILQR